MAPLCEPNFQVDRQETACFLILLEMEQGIAVRLKYTESLDLQNRLINLLNHQLHGSLLKIWNMNDANGVLGVFNCQGASWCRTSIKNLIHDQQPPTISSTIQPTDVEYLHNTAWNGWNGDCIMYSHRGGTYLSQKNK